MAADRSIDVEPLLPGENRKTPFADDAQHWISVYSEFVRFKSDLLSTVEAERAALSPAVAEALSATVVSQLVDQFGSLQRRLSFWQARLAELTRQR